MVLIDVSFTSVQPIIAHIINEINQAVVLLKPQFETEGKYLKNGILKSEKIHRKVLDEFLSFLKLNDLKVLGFKPSSLKGKDGNLEYLFYITK